MSIKGYKCIYILVLYVTFLEHFVFFGNILRIIQIVILGEELLVWIKKAFDVIRT